MIGTVIQADLEEIIQSKNWDELRAALSEFEPPDIAEIIIDLPSEDEGVIFRVLPRDRAAAVFSYLPLEHQESLLRSLSNEQMRGILDQMTPDDRTRLLEELPAEVTRKLLESLSPEELKAARELLGYPPETAGRYMTPEYVALDRDLTTEQAIQQIRRTGRGKETLNVLYVLDKDGTLMHDLRLGTLVMADPQAKVGEIKDRNLVSIPASAGRADVIEVFEKYDRAAMPVTDAQGHMLGIITADDVLDVAEQEATEDIQKMGGSEALDAPYFAVGFMDMVRKRGGWLAILFVGEMLTATAMGYFQGEISKAVVLALFVPLIISSGGNSGSQATSLIIRAMALREVGLRDWWRVFARELPTGLALGGILGAIGVIRILSWEVLGWANYGAHAPLIAVTVGCSLIGVVLFGTLAGSLLPFALRRVGFDPASASAPFVATLVDVSGLVIYFTVASIILHGTLL